MGMGVDQTEPSGRGRVGVRYGSTLVACLLVKKIASIIFGTILCES